jgi:hypothetical protein
MEHYLYLISNAFYLISLLLDFKSIFPQSITNLKANINIMNEIIIRHKYKKRIKDELKTSYMTIRMALLGETDTKLSIRIREKALEMGGVEVVKPQNNLKMNDLLKYLQDVIFSRFVEDAKFYATEFIKNESDGCWKEPVCSCALGFPGLRLSCH